MEKDRSLWLAKMADFTEVVYGLRRENPKMQMQEAFEAAAKMPAKRFYVSAQNAARFVSRIDRGEDTKLKNRNKIAMFEEIHRRWVVYRAERRAVGRLKVTNRELENVINSEAPGFFEDAETLRCAFYKYLRKK